MKLMDELKEVEFGNEGYFEILPSGIERFIGEKSYLSTESIKKTKIEKIECKISFNNRPSRANMQPILNSIWFAKMKSTLKVYVFNELNKEEIEKYVLSTGFTGIKVMKTVSPKYVRYFLLTDYFNRIKDYLCSGATQKAIKNEKIRKIKIPLPNLSTQKKIVSILEKAEKAKELRKGADELTKDYLKSVFLEMFGDPESNPKNFPKSTIRELVGEVKYGTSVKSIEAGKYPYLRMNNITYDGEMDFKNLKYIDLDDKDKEKYLAKKNDILFNRTNSKELVGKTAVFMEDKPMVIAGYLIRVRVNENANPQYISGYLNSIHGKKVLENMCKSIVGMANINAQELQNIPIQIPPIELQNKFASIVKEVETMKEKQKQSKEQIEDLFKALMQKAFKGELVC